MLKLTALTLAAFALLATPAGAQVAPPPAGSTDCPDFAIGSRLTGTQAFVEDVAAMPCEQVAPLIRRALREAEFDAGAWVLGGGDAGCGVAPAAHAGLSVRCSAATYMGAVIELRGPNTGKRCAPTHWSEGVARAYVLRGIPCAKRKRFMRAALNRAAVGDGYEITRVDGVWCSGLQIADVFHVRWTCAAPDGRAARFVTKGS
jgi:hypothetical protein